MGQYWYPVNLDKREYIDPCKFGTGRKLWEQVANYPGTGAALIILTAAMPEMRGGGDLDLDENWHGSERTAKHNLTPGPMPEPYPKIAHRTIGRWAGDRIAIVGDYAEQDDLAPEHDADLIYGLCCDADGASAESRQEKIAFYRKRAAEVREKGEDLYGHSAEEYEQTATRFHQASLYRDISEDVCAVLEHELQGKFVGEGRREFKRSKITPQL